MIVYFGALFLGLMTQALFFVGLPIPWKKLGYCILIALFGLVPIGIGLDSPIEFRIGFSIILFCVAFVIQFKNVVLFLINEQSLWLMTLIFWYLLWRYTPMDLQLFSSWIVIIIGASMTVMVFIATFTRTLLPSVVSILFYMWFLVLDLFISIIFLIQSPSNIFVDPASKSVIDYYFFGMVFLHLVALVYYLFTSAWWDQMASLGSLYKDRQVSLLYPLVTTMIAFVVLIILPRYVAITDFAFVGSLLGIGTWVTGQRMGYQKVGTNPNIK